MSCTCLRKARPTHLGGKRITSRRKANNKSNNAYVYVLDYDGCDGDGGGGDGDSTLIEQIKGTHNTTKNNNNKQTPTHGNNTQQKQQTTTTSKTDEATISPPQLGV